MNNGEDNLKQQKAGNPFFILIIFAALIAFLFYIPDIYQKYNKEISNFLSGGKTEEGEKNEEKENKAGMSAYYMLGSKSTLKFNEILLSDISLNQDKTITFTVNTDDMIDLDELDYYVEFYRERTVFLGRRVLHGKVTRNRKLRSMSPTCQSRRLPL